MQASISIIDAMLTVFGLALPASIALLPSGQSINYTNSVPYSFIDNVHIVGGSFHLLMIKARLTTEIRESNLCYVHILLHISLKRDSSNLTRFYRVVNCNPIRSHNGLGFRYCTKGKIHTISANHHIRLEDESGQEVLISSQNPGEWADTTEAALKTA